MRVAVVGGGISGLAAAWFLADAGADVTVLEASPEVGGKLRLGSVAGHVVDVGAESMLARRPEGSDLAQAVGLSLVAPQTTAARIWAGGAAHPLPPRTMLGIPADVDAVRAAGVLSADGLARLAAEPGLPPMQPLDGDVSVGAVVRDRLGAEVLDRLVEPLLGGVYAGRADALSLRATMPALAARLAGGGSLVEAAQAVTDVGSHDPSAGPVFAAVAGGMGRLPQALAASGRFTVRTGTTARSVERDGPGFRLVLGAVPFPETIAADAVVVALPPVKAALALRQVAPAAAAELREIETASVAIVSMAFPDVALPAGSGMLVAPSSGLAVKGITITSQKWPGHDAVLLRASVGRAGESRDLQRSDLDLVALVREELKPLLGVTASPLDVLVTRWGGGLPQYGVGHVERVARIRTAVSAEPGLAVCGAAFDGVGIPACIASARAAVEQILRQAE